MKIDKTPVRSKIAAKSYGSAGRHLTLAAAFLNNTTYFECEGTRPEVNPGKYASQPATYWLADLLAPCIEGLTPEKLRPIMHEWITKPTSCRHDLLPETIPERFRVPFSAPEMEQAA